MKLLKILFIAAIFMVATEASFAQKAAIGTQNVQCTLVMKNAPKQVKNILDLSNGFNKQKHQIIFAMEGGKADIIFQTIVRKNGKVIGNTQRKPMAYFPGELYLPAQTFDFLSILPYEKKSQEKFGQLENGNYEIELKAIPTEGKSNSNTESVIFKFVVKNL